MKQRWQENRELIIENRELLTRLSAINNAVARAFIKDKGGAPFPGTMRRNEAMALLKEITALTEGLTRVHDDEPTQ